VAQACELETPNGKVRARLRGVPGDDPREKRFRSLTYEVKDKSAAKGFGIGSAGLHLPCWWRPTGAGGVVLSISRATWRRPADRERQSTSGLLRAPRAPQPSSRSGRQAHADPWLRYTQIDGVGFVVSSAYVEDIDWGSSPRRWRRSPGSRRAAAKTTLRRRRGLRHDPRRLPDRGRDHVGAVGGGRGKFVREWSTSAWTSTTTGCSSAPFRRIRVCNAGDAPF